MDKSKLYKKGSCMLWAEITTKKLLKNKINNFIVCEGYVIFLQNDKNENKKSPTFQHTWIKLKNGKILDETLNQFNGWNLNTVKRQCIKKYIPQEYLDLCIMFPVNNEELYISEDKIINFKQFLKNQNRKK